VPAVTTQTVETLAALQDLPVPAEDLAGLAAGLHAHLEAIATLLERLPLEDAEPPLRYDPRWL
jgi:hypothetical protein